VKQNFIVLSEQHKLFISAYRKAGVVRAQGYSLPEFAVVGNGAPFLANCSDSAQLSMMKITEDVEQEFIRKLVDIFLKR
jgi:hypothetical protein